MAEGRTLKSLIFVGSSRDDIQEFPEEVRQDIGYALFEVQKGGPRLEGGGRRLQGQL